MFVALLVFLIFVALALLITLGLIAIGVFLSRQCEEYESVRRAR